jgi:hypothetical protein
MKYLKNKFLVFAASYWLAALLLLTGFYLFVYAPKSDKLARLKTVIAQKQKKYEFAKDVQKPEKRQKLVNKLDELQQKVNKFSIPDEKAPSLTFSISEAASRLNVNEFTSAARRKKDNESIIMKGYKHLGENRIIVEFESPYYGFASFINQMELNDPVIFVDKFNIKSSGVGKKYHPVTIVLSVLVRHDENQEKNS